MRELHNEQANTKASDIGPEDYAEALAEPMLAVMKGLSVTAKAAYELATENASKIVGGDTGKEVVSDDVERTA
jgi:hypothetical protein